MTTTAVTPNNAAQAAYAQGAPVAETPENAGLAAPPPFRRAPGAGGLDITI